ncbi:C-type lectin (CTL) or carbohydrate-recognition domain (CRD) [Mactra antiquata]
MLFLTAAVLWLHCAALVRSCGVGFVAHGDSCYHFSHDREAFELAQLVCKQLGASLAEVDSIAEGQYLSSMLAGKSSDHHWIGLSDIREEGTWRWHTTGEVLKPAIAMWDTHEPNNSRPGLENCVVIKTDGKWGDTLCMESHPYICEMPYERIDVG